MVKLNDPSLIDPSKIRGKFTPEKESTDLNTDPIDNPPEAQKTKIKPIAAFEQKEKDTRPIDQVVIWLAILLTLFSAISTAIIPIAGLNLIVQLASAVAALYFNLKNSHLQEKIFPRLGINPLHIITTVDCLLTLVAAINLLLFFLSLGA